MARPVTYLTTKVDDFLSIDLAWIRGKGGRSVGHSGRISWSRAGAETASIRYESEHGACRMLREPACFKGSSTMATMRSETLAWGGSAYGGFIDALGGIATIVLAVLGLGHTAPEM